MEFIQRILSPKLQQMATKFPFVTITGPRQSGKSTIARMSFPDYRVVSLEDLDMRQFATDDPRGFIETFPEKTIIDEVQRVPSLLSYLQTYTDSRDSEGMYILTGSQNSLIMEAVDQTLAGRTSLLTLLPLSARELMDAGRMPNTINELIFNGGYPRLYAKDINPNDYYPGYISTYVERDVRQLLKIGDLGKFVKFIKLCAGRIGQLVNMSSLAVETGVTVPTINAWLSVLQASYVVYLLHPYYENFSKRLVKTPKLYFYDTGVACQLLDIKNASQLSNHYLHGGLFENLVINELIKRYTNQGVNPLLWFWRDGKGNEIDLVDTTLGEPVCYEVKSGCTFSSDFFKGLGYWSKLTGGDPCRNNVVYCGDISMNYSSGRLLSFNKFATDSE